MKSIKQFLKPEKVAKQLGISVEALLAWRFKGMPVIKISKYVFIYEPDFAAWMEKQKDLSEEVDKKSANR